MLPAVVKGYSPLQEFSSRAPVEAASLTLGVTSVQSGTSAVAALRPSTTRFQVNVGSGLQELLEVLPRIPEMAVLGTEPSGARKELRAPPAIPGAAA